MCVCTDLFLDLSVTAETDKESDSGLTAGHCDDVQRDLSTLTDIFLATGRDVEGTLPDISLDFGSDGEGTSPDISVDFGSDVEHTSPDISLGIDRDVEGTSPDISLDIGRDVEGGVVRMSQQDRATLIQLRSSDDVKEQLEFKRKKTMLNSSFSSSNPDASSPQSEFSVLLYFSN